MDRRHFLATGSAVTATAAIGLGPAPVLAQAAAGAGAASTASISGPVTGGRRGWPIGSYPSDLSAVGYVEEEFFIEGEARSFRPAAPFDPLTGQWEIMPDGTAPYRTRLLVHRPADPARFNGTVLVEWINVSPGHENQIVPDASLYDGFAYVGVAAQYVGVHGFADLPDDQRTGMTQWDPDRYATLTHPGDAFSFDIFEQAGRALRASGSAGGPLPGFAIRHLVATGASQSAARLRTFINAFHPRGRVFDAFVPFLDWAGYAEVVQPDLPVSRPPGFRTGLFRSPNPTVIRTDLDVPVMIVNTENEAYGFRGPAREFALQPDSDKFRLWEVAGAPHSADIPGDPVTRAATAQRDGLRRGQQEPGTLPGSQVTSWHCTIAGYHHVHRWLNEGSPPPVMPLLEFTSEDPPKLLRDEMGIGMGGIRLPEVSVPVAMNTALSTMPGVRFNRGLRLPFADETLRLLYPSREDYVSKVTAAAEALSQAGAIRPYRVAEYVEMARAQPLPTG